MLEERGKIRLGEILNFVKNQGDRGTLGRCSLADRQFRRIGCQIASIGGSVLLPTP